MLWIYGYVYDENDKLIVDNERAKFVKQIFELYLAD